VVRVKWLNSLTFIVNFRMLAQMFKIKVNSHVCNSQAQDEEQRISLSVGIPSMAKTVKAGRNMYVYAVPVPLVSLLGASRLDQRKRP
jgi:hypothetical protein